MPNALYHGLTGERNTRAAVNYGPRDLSPKEIAAVVHTERPSGVWIDLARCRVELARPDRAPLAFLFASAADAFAAGLAAEVERRQLANEPAGALRYAGKVVRRYRRR